MPYTSHGHPYGNTSPDEPRPDHVARCGGPAMCRQCATEANRATADQTTNPDEMADLKAQLAAAQKQVADLHDTFASLWGVFVPLFNQSLSAIRPVLTAAGFALPDLKVIDATTAAPEEPRRDGQLLHVNAITGDDRHPMTATQWAVGHPDGRHTCYGDQEWVACGQAAEEDGPGSTTMYRSVTITYGPWVEVPR